jgi:hypothetical protein
MTPIYSFLPPYHTDPQEVLDLAPRNMLQCIKNRVSYPMWPWAVEEMNNTAWRSLHSGAIKLVRLTTERDGKPVLDAKCILGFWADDGRFVVEHWVRVDHLPLGAQLMWFGVEIAYWRAQAKWWTDGPRAWLHDPSYALSPKSCRARVREAQQQTELALRRARAFAVGYGLSLGPEILNAGIECASAEMQMALL